MSNKLNSNDYKILESIIDVKNNRGKSKGRGSTLKQIAEKTELSEIKIRKTIKVLLELGFIDFAVKKVRANAYYVTEDGVKNITEVRKNIF